MNNVWQSLKDFWCLRTEEPHEVEVGRATIRVKLVNNEEHVLEVFGLSTTYNGDRGVVVSDALAKLNSYVSRGDGILRTTVPNVFVTVANILSVIGKADLYPHKDKYKKITVRRLGGYWGSYYEKLDDK